MLEPSVQYDTPLFTRPTHAIRQQSLRTLSYTTTEKRENTRLKCDTYHHHAAAASSYVNAPVCTPCETY